MLQTRIIVLILLAMVGLGCTSSLVEETAIASTSGNRITETPVTTNSTPIAQEVPQSSIAGPEENVNTDVEEEPVMETLDGSSGIQPVTEPSAVTPEPVELFLITSPAFADGGYIPQKYACDGQELSPPLTISGTPVNARSLILIMTDLDVPYAYVSEVPEGEFVHWVVFNMDPATREIMEGRQPAGIPGTGFSEIYSGPCPPSDLEPKEHRYVFTVYALDTILDLPQGSTKQQVMNAMENHVLTQAQLMGKYQIVE